MILAVLVASALQGQQTPPPAGRPVPQSRTVVKDSTSDTTSGRRVARRIPVTAEHLATAFKDGATRDLFLKARQVRIHQDSTLRNYDATEKSRLSIDLGIGSTGREHVMFREESAARVQWQRDIGVWIDLTGARAGIPFAPKEAEIDAILSDLQTVSPIPYYPGYEALWTGGESTARTEANERDIVNPLAVGSEAYYTFARGDSIAFSLPDGTRILLQEIEVRPRSVRWNLAVGSLWFDVHGQLVRAVYRLSTPVDMWTTINDDEKAKGKSGVSPLISGFLSPIQAQISGIAIEYSLFGGQYWMPRLRSMSGNAQMLFAKVPVQIDQRFQYTTVNGPDTLRKMDQSRLPQYSDSGRFGEAGDSVRFGVRRDSLRAVARVADSTTRARHATMSADQIEAERAQNARRRDSVSRANEERSRVAHETWTKHLKAVSDSVEQGLPASSFFPMGGSASAQCDSTGRRTTYTRMFVTRLPVAVQIPCNLTTLIHSPDLPKSIYDPGEEVFSHKDVDELMAKGLDMAAQAPFSLKVLPDPSIVWGLAMTRYNRVEGFSTGAKIDQQLGGGISAGAALRFGFADKNPNVELTAARSNLTKTIRVSGYHRLVSASDWGNPLGFGSSFSALVFGRDEGFYYRATGGDVTWTRGVTSKFEWRLFADNEKTALTNTQFAMVHHASTDTFPSNIVASEGTYFGGGLHIVHNHGLDPRGFRTFTDLRLEGAKGDSLYGRAAGELTMSEGLPFMTAVGVTLSAGSSLGFLPTQRNWFLGGTQTVRGQSADIAQSGNAFWLTRLELGKDNPGHRSTIFGDLGWAGDRNRLAEIGRPLSGVGYGESMFDGILRFDVARGLYPRKQWRFDLYWEARF